MSEPAVHFVVKVRLLLICVHVQLCVSEMYYITVVLRLQARYVYCINATYEQLHMQVS